MTKTALPVLTFGYFWFQFLFSGSGYQIQSLMNARQAFWLWARSPAGYFYILRNKHLQKWKHLCTLSLPWMPSPPSPFQGPSVFNWLSYWCMLGHVCVHAHPCVHDRFESLVRERIRSGCVRGPWITPTLDMTGITNSALATALGQRRES